MDLAEEIASSPERMRVFQQERLATEITELISRLMREQKLSRAELASRLGKSRPFVTKLLRTGTNMTVHTLADVFYALGHSLRVVERPLSVFTPCLHVTEIPSAHGQTFAMSFTSVPLSVGDTTFFTDVFTSTAPATIAAQVPRISSSAGSSASPVEGLAA
jgi:transcriptional regulator with XRE-family HTH domain